MTEGVKMQLLGDELEPCKVSFHAWGVNVLIRLESDNYTVFLSATRNRICEVLRELIGRVEEQIPSAAPARPEQRQQMTPADVVRYFNASEVLKPHASEVAKALDVSASDSIADIDLVLQHLTAEELFRADGSPSWGSRAAIARVLSIQDGGGYRKRIDDVLLALKTTTTTPKHAPNPVEIKKIA